MHYSNLVNRSFGIAFRNFSLWAITLIFLAFQVVFNLVFSSLDIVFIILRALVTLLVTAALAGALIGMVNDIAEGKITNMSSGFTAAMAYTPKMLGLTLLLSVPGWIVALLSTGNIFIAFSSALGQSSSLSSTNLTSLLGSLSLLVIVSLIIGILVGGISVGAQRALVLENSGVIAAVLRGWALFTQYLVNYIVLGLIFIALSIVFGILIGCATSIFTIGSLSSGSAGGFSLAVVVSSVVGLVSGSFFAVFGSTVWTLAFRFWQGKDDAAPYIRPTPPYVP